MTSLYSPTCIKNRLSEISLMLSFVYWVTLKDRLSLFSLFCMRGKHLTSLVSLLYFILRVLTWLGSNYLSYFVFISFSFSSWPQDDWFSIQRNIFIYSQFTLNFYKGLTV